MTGQIFSDYITSLAMMFVLLGLMTASQTVMVKAQPVVAGPPTPLLSLRTGSEIHVDITPPATDGGAEITSYAVDWDTKPGIREVQTIRDKCILGAQRDPDGHIICSKYR